jgi:hypothetical protein
MFLFCVLLSQIFELKTYGSALNIRVHCLIIPDYAWDIDVRKHAG